MICLCILWLLCRIFMFMFLFLYWDLFSHMIGLTVSADCNTRPCMLYVPQYNMHTNSSKQAVSVQQAVCCGCEWVFSLLFIAWLFHQLLLHWVSDYLLMVEDIKYLIRSLSILWQGNFIDCIIRWRKTFHCRRLWDSFLSGTILCL